VFALKKKAFAPGTAYTAADGGPFVGTIDLTTGIISPIVTGLKAPGGVAFVDTTPRAADAQHDAVLGEDDESCRDHGSGWALAERLGTSGPASVVGEILAGK